MSPSPDSTEHQLPAVGSDILITGMSGRFPKSTSIKEFHDNLYNKVDLLDEPTERWEFSHPEMPPRLGVCPDMATFDAQFFGIHYKQSTSFDPTIRKLLECACEAIVDAGVNPKSLRNTNTGVFITASISESEKNLNYDSSTISGYGLTGSSRSMMANRISFWLGTRGPSYSSDNACCGGALALQQAFHAMSNGYCDSAIVGSSNLCLEPCINLHFRWMELLTLGEKTKSFDQSADGYARSDSIVVFFLQKPKDAKRVYAQLVHTKAIYTGISELDHTFQVLDPERFGCFLNDFYKEIDVNPNEVEYIEACGTGVNKADYHELLKIDEVFCSGKRGKPVKVGCVKSNMGNSEASSPLSALVKVCLAYNKGEIPGNLHLVQPRTDVAAVREGRIHLLADHEAFSKGYAAVNTYSYNGVNGHILLKDYDIGKRKSTKYSELPYLVCVSSRNETSLERTFKDLESNELDPRQIALINNVYGNELVGFLLRGYKIFSFEEDKPVSVCESSEYFDGTQRPVWFVYSGMGSQWPTMGAQLMTFPVFAAAIDRCCRVLESKDLDLMRLLTDPDPETFSNILHSFVAIAAVQIGLTDLLHSLGIRPDNIIGHSVGELGCAYADGCLSAEEMILAAYYRGLVSIETPLIKGSMAAVGLGHFTTRSVSPPEIEVACHNGHDSCTISGPADIMKIFVAELTRRGVFAKEVACSNIAYHSRYISSAGPALKKYMSQVIKDPKQRSSRWISSSVPQVRWDEAAARFCSAEYLTNNLLNPVLFEEASRMIPDNAITIEIAPHGLLQAILNRSLSSNCINVALTRRAHKDNVLHVLNAIGKLYIAGLYPKVDNLYPPVQFPVASDTPLLSHTLAWVHDEVWPVGCGRRPAPLNTGKYHYVLSTKDYDHEYLTGNFINGVNLYPAAAQLVLIWETLARVLGAKYTELSVRFQNVQFLADVVIPKDDPLELIVFLQQSSGNFEITKQGVAVSMGQIIVTKNFNERTLVNLEMNDVVLNCEDIYRLLALRGYNYRGKFRSIKSVNGNFSKSQIHFKENWVTFLDALMQFSVLNNNNTGISRPKRIQSLDINLKEFKNAIGNMKNDVEVQFYEKHLIARCPGIEMKEFVTEDYNITLIDDSILKKYIFVPFYTKIEQENEALKLHVQTLLENFNNKKKIDVIELLNNETEHSLKRELDAVFKQLPENKMEIQLTSYNIKKDNITEINKNILNSNLIITHNLSKTEEIQKELFTNLTKNAFVLTFENASVVDKDFKHFQKISCIQTTKHNIVLLRKSVVNPKTKIILVDKKDNSWIQKVEDCITSKNNVLIVITKEGHAVIDEINLLLREEQNNDKVKLFIIQDKDTPSFDPKLHVYAEQIQKNLAINVLKRGAWGSYRYTEIEPPNQKLEYTQLSLMNPGDWDTLTWTEALPPQESNRILVKVHYARVTCSDLMRVKRRKQLVYGETNLDRSCGMSFSGTTKSGNRVMGLVKSNTIASTVEADSELLWPVPEHWTLEEAATVPRAYVQALYYLLYKSTRVPSDLSVMVTSGSGALGQAIISACLHTGCQIFTTVGQLSKRNLLLKMFPQLNESNVCTTEDTVLMQMIAESTDGRGCDLVVNSASGSRRLVTMECLAPFSNYIDIALQDMEDNIEFGMSFAKNEKSYLAANFASVFEVNQLPLRKNLRKSILDGIQEGWVRPLSHVVFEAPDVSRAFRFLSGRRNHGAVLLRLRHPTSAAPNINVTPTWKASKDGSHIVVCDKDALGVEIAERLVQLGVRNLILHTEYINNGYLQYKVKCWSSAGVNVTISSEDLSSEKGSSDMLSNASKLGPLISLFYIRSSCDKKSTQYDLIIKNLDSASRVTKLEKFVIITSETYKDKLLNHTVTEICEDRIKSKLPALILNTLISQQNEFEETQMETKSVSLLRASRFLDLILARNSPVVSVYPTARKHKNLTNVLAKALDLENLEGLDENLTVQDFNLDQHYVNELCNTLVDTYNRCQDLVDILSMTIHQIKKLDNEQRFDEDTGGGFSMFFRHYERENLFVSEPLVWMPSVISDGDNRVDFYKGEDYLIVVPGMDGQRHAMYRLCRRLRLRAVVCQYPVETKQKSVQELAQHFATTIKTKIGIGNKFYILGYSFGALVALEMASIFENSGMEGKLFCLDGSPMAMKAILTSQMQNLTEDQQQNYLLSHMCQLMTDGQKKNLVQIVEQEKTWESKLTACLTQMNGIVEEPFEFQRLTLEAAYKRIIQAKEYKRDGHKLKSEVILLRAKGTLELPKDYGLADVTIKPITIYDLVSTHVSAPYDLRCSDIINRELSLDKSTIDAAIGRLNQLNSSIDGRMIR